MSKKFLYLTGWLFVSYALINLVLCLSAVLVPYYFTFLSSTPSLFFNSAYYTTLFNDFGNIVIFLISLKFLIILFLGIRFFKLTKLIFKKQIFWLILTIVICFLLGQFILSFLPLLFLMFNKKSVLKKV